MRVAPSCFSFFNLVTETQKELLIWTAIFREGITRVESCSWCYIEGMQFARFSVGEEGLVVSCRPKVTRECKATNISSAENREVMPCDT